jgi:hypothetical protein|eukprot:gene11449-11539_t
MNSNTAQLTQLLQLIRTDLINSLQANGKDASGQTAKQLTITTGEDSAQLELPGYMKLLETGRGPTHPGAVPGNPPMILRIQQWCQERGIPAKAAWAIKKSIDKKGFKGVPGLLTEPLGNDNINARLHPLLEELAQEIIKCIANESG